MHPVTRSQRGGKVSIAQLAAVIGRTGTYRTNGLLVPVVVLDVKQAFGRSDVQIAPCDATGQPVNESRAWVAIYSVRINPTVASLPVNGFVRTVCSNTLAGQFNA